MKINRNKILLFFIIAIYNLPAVSQQNDSSEETFLGIGSGNRRISKFQKSSIFPLNTDSITIIENIKYYLEPKQQLISYKIEDIKPARLKITANGEKLYRGYLKAGIGNYLTPLLDLNYASKRSRDESWGLNSNMHGSFSNIKGMGNTKYSDFILGGYYQKFFLNYDFWSEIKYQRNSFQLYGVDYSDSLMYQFYDVDFNNNSQLESFKDDDNLFKQNYDLFDMHLKFNSVNTGRDTNKIRIKSWVDYHHLNSNYNLSENHFLVGAHSGWLVLDEEFLATFEIDINNINAPSVMELDENKLIQPRSMSTKSSGIVRLNPHIYSRKNNFIFKAGLSVQANIGEATKFHVFPDFDISYSLFNDIFIPYGGWSGNVQRNTFNNIRLENPFISEDSKLQNTIQKSNLFVGIRGSLSNKFTFNVSTSFQKLDSMYFFVVDTISSYGNKFQMVYDNLRKNTFLAEITYQENEKLKISAKAEYFIYNLVNFNNAWQRPDFIFTLSGLLDLADKIILKSDIYFVGTRPSFSYSEPKVENELNGDKYIYDLKSFLDMNISLEYRYTKKVSAFIQFNNFTGKKYQYWTNFPVQSINILGGVTFSF